MSSTGSMLMANGDDCLEGWVGAECEEVKGGDVVLEVTKREKWWNGGELDGGLMRQHARTLIRAVRFRVLFSFLSLDDFGMVMIKELLEFGNEDAIEEMAIYRWTYACHLMLNLLF
ncbi:hypothetical protein Tco_0848519 [Tanacetum coccineum]